MERLTGLIARDGATKRPARLAATFPRKRPGCIGAMDGSAQRGAVLVIVLVLVMAGAMLAASVAGSAALELSMAGRADETLRAFQAADAGLSAALASAAWNPGAVWGGSGSLPEGGDWAVTIRLTAASTALETGLAEWHFEAASEGRYGAAVSTMVQGFVVSGALPGEPVLTYWRREDPEP